ncbi:MAG TPA: glycoside hydrolase family 99-like domain-containing protein [Kiritimatiellia bacterium]|mgnify:CR=1 FL=1|nr:glycoside hydrolase family 99-like domain-containing protein [Kiritimatiellia bacterium]HPS06914.1 glycoside hydrolase family 99-like domain-containing protein [Kiritimatiellia bacterium]
MGNTRVVMAVALAACVNMRAQAQTGNGPRPEVAAIYYPHWHRYDHGSAWKGEGWTEWEGLKAAVPRFPGHVQPLKPTWGYFDESDPAWTAKEIDLAKDNGIDVFIYDWYWYSGVKNMEEALEQGFLKAPNRGRMKFALMWANHHRRDQFCPEYGKPRTIWLHSYHSEKDLTRMIDYCIEHYFREPNYWRVRGGLFYSIFQAKEFVDQMGGPEKTRAAFKRIDERLGKANLPPMHWNAMVSTPARSEAMRAAGFHSTSRYNVSTAGKVKPDATEDYGDVMEAHRKHWKAMQTAQLMDIPVVTRGWDSSPRCRADVPWPFPRTQGGGFEYPYSQIVTGVTPERFEQLLRDAAQAVRDDSKAPPAVLINAWNEWTEGQFLLPEEHYGTAHLEAIRNVFGTAAK